MSGITGTGTGPTPATTAVPQITIGTGLAAMPVAGSREAPKQFTGDAIALEDFLERFNILIGPTGANLADSDKFLAIKMYVDVKRRRLFESLNGWSTKLWPDFVKALNEVYATKEAQKRYSKRQLIRLVKRQAEKRIDDEDELLEYYREFAPVSKWLMDNKKITEEDRDYHFWMGFGKRNRRQLEQYLMATKPTYDRETPWKMNDVFSAAQKLYDSLIFDHGPQLGIDSDYELDLTLDDDLDDDDELIRPSKRLAKAGAIEQIKKSTLQPDGTQEVVKRTVQFSPTTDIAPAPIQTQTTGQVPQEPLDDLIGRLHGLNISDRTYMVTYAKLAALYPGVADRFPRPQIAGVYTGNRDRQSTNPNSIAGSSPAYIAPRSNSSSAPAGTFRCFFCNKQSPDCYGMKTCTTAKTYMDDKKIIQQNGYYVFPNGDRIPRHEKGLQYVVDEHYKHGARVGFLFTIEKADNTSGSDSYAFVSNDPNNQQETSRIDTAIEELRQICVEEFDRKNVMAGAFTRSQSRQNDDSQQPSQPQSQPPQATPSQPSQTRTTPPTTPSTLQAQSTPPRPSQTPSILRPNRGGGEDQQYALRSKAAEERSVESVLSKLLDQSVRLDLRDILAVSPDLRRAISDLVKLRRVPTPDVAVNYAGPKTTKDPFDVTVLSWLKEPSYSEPVREIDIELPNGVHCRGVFDTASQIVAIRQDILRLCGHPVNPNLRINMTTADAKKSTLEGCAEHLPIKVGPIMSLANAHVVKHAPYDILLGFSWIDYVKAMLMPSDNGWVVRMENPLDFHHVVEVPTFAHYGPSIPQYDDAVKAFAFIEALPESPESPATPPHLSLELGPATNFIIEQSYGISHPHASLIYKKVENKVRPVSTTTPEDCQVIRQRTFDPIDTLQPLSIHPPPFTPTGRLTQERWDKLAVGKDGFLWPEEVKLVGQVLMLDQRALAWNEEERGSFRKDWFPDVKIPVIEHTPFALPVIRIPPGLYKQYMDIIVSKIKSGEYEPSNASYRSPIFPVYKKDGLIRLVHNLTALNSVTIRDAGLPPPIDSFVEWFAGSASFSLFDIYAGYPEQGLHVGSRALTTFDTPIGTLRLTSLPQGWTNSVPIFQSDIAFLLEPFRNFARNYIDDVPVKGEPTRYELPDGGYETIDGNPGIRRFIWEQCNKDHQILHTFQEAGITVSGKKIKMCVPSVVILGHLCTYGGRIPDTSHVDKVLNWPTPTDVTGVRGFLGVCGVVRIFIKGFAQIAKPLVELTKKNVEWTWSSVHDDAMATLKERITSAPCIRPIDYESGLPVTVEVDSSSIAVGFKVSQDDTSGRRIPARYGSITWNDRESRYSQAKLELYGLYRALTALKLYLVGLPTFTVEMDAASVKGMIQKPDLQPAAVMNRWIAGILLFNFELKHVRASDFKGPDGLSRRPLGEGEEIGDGKGDEVDEWLDERLGYGVWVETMTRMENNTLSHKTKQSEAEEMMLVPQVRSYAYGESQTTSEEVVIPRTDDSTTADLEVEAIKEYLHTHERPSHISPTDFKAILSRSTKFFLYQNRLFRRRPKTGHHQLVIDYPNRLDLLISAHDRLGHKGIYSTRQQLLDRVWWPGLEADVKWFCSTCHQCQLRSNAKIYLDPGMSTPATLFRKVHIDTMLMPKANKCRYLVQARDSLSSYVEWIALENENAKTLANFIFRHLLCRYGAIAEIVTDNGKPYIGAADILNDRYSIHHIKISVTNSRANGFLERNNRTLRDSIVKACGGNINRWPEVTHHVVWADRVTIRKATGYFPFYMVHGIEPVLPLDIVYATYLAPKVDRILTTEELITLRVRQLERREEDLEEISKRIIESRYASIAQFRKEHANQIREQDFAPGTLVLVRNVYAEKDLGGKHLPRYFGPMIVITGYKRGAYRLAELDGSVSKLRYAAYRLLPYHQRNSGPVPFTNVITSEELHEVEDEEDQDDESVEGEERYFGEED